MKQVIDVVGAVIVQDELVLCVQRGPASSLPGMWEFPGGKIEPGEDETTALRREIAEELVCHVVVGEAVTTTAYDYDFATVRLMTFYCELTAGMPTLTEHVELAWLPPDRLLELQWAPADVPAVMEVMHHLGGQRP